MALVTGVFGVWRVLLCRHVNQQLAGIRAAGLPASGAELNRWRPAVSDAENGALLMEGAFSLRRAIVESEVNEAPSLRLLIDTNDWSPETRALVEDCVRTNAAVLATAREALQAPKFRYAADFSYGPETPLPHLHLLNQIAHIAALQSVLDADSGRWHEWAEDILFQLKLAGTLDTEPTPVAFRMRNLIIHTAFYTVQQGLNRASPSDAACKRVEAAFAKAGETNLLPAALIGDRAILIPTFRLGRKEIQSFSESDETEGQPRPPQRYGGKPVFFTWFTGFFERDLSFYLDNMEQLIARARLPTHESLAQPNPANAICETARKRIFIMSGLLLPAVPSLVGREAAMEAQTRLASLALTVERYRSTHGRLPETLTELTPAFLAAIPVDPFDGKPLRYRRLARGYVLYSVDWDRQDDGGRQPPTPKKYSDNTSYDLTFVVNR